MNNLSIKNILTRAVHAGERKKNGEFIPVSTPIWPTVGYLYDNMDDMDAVLGNEKEGFVYPRYASPTVSALEEAIASLEEAEGVQVYATGMAAIHSALLAAGAKTGSIVFASQDIYGATYSLLKGLFSTLGVKYFFLDTTDLDYVDKKMKEQKPTVLIVESISNPLLKIADISGLGEISKKHGVNLIVDNTFATPYLLNPLRLGADYVVHSATKYMAGHGDAMAGVIGSSLENKKKLFDLNKMIGSNLGPFEAWLVLRGLKTLPLRMKQHCQNALIVADMLQNHKQISKVNFPGFTSHPQYDLAVRQFDGKGFGGMLSFEITGADKKKVFKFMESLELCLPATTLGDVYSLVLHPATASHRSLSPQERADIGIQDNLVRLSVGIEDASDILYDLNQALSKI